ncbi:MAG TPA: response regulator [Gemmatimonadaceae bacterium]|jgi:DNA-binding NtrC family response regulator|nr:response regulator [Gemmatimonadaceae bacterium]
MKQNGDTRRFVLIVDPHDGVCAVLRRMLNDANIETVIAKSCAEALTLVKSHGELIDVLLTELEGPECAGAGLIADALRHRPHLPIVCMSTAANDDVHIRRLVPARAAVVPKPFTVAQLTAAIARAVAA